MFENGFLYIFFKFQRHSRVVGELEEERRKHEHDTAQGDDVTYALEKDRTRLKQVKLCLFKITKEFIVCFEI